MLMKPLFSTYPSFGRDALVNTRLQRRVDRRNHNPRSMQMASHAAFAVPTLLTQIRTCPSFDVNHKSCKRPSMAVASTDPVLKQIANGGVTAARGFRAEGTTVGFKESGLPDLAVITAEDPENAPATAAAVFTQCRVRAAPVDISEKHIRSSGGLVAAIIVNSGQANAATGEGGREDALETARMAAATLHCDPDQVLVASTGMIGVRFNMNKMKEALPSLLQSALQGGDGPVFSAGQRAARAIMTTDLKQKEVAFETSINGKTVRIGGMAKGSGMIHPNMATMLAFVTCDASVEQKLWQDMLQRVTLKSFNVITVDGDTSTNDVLFALCSGKSGVVVSDSKSQEAVVVEQLLMRTCTELAKKIARDGEGATLLIEVRVTGTATDNESRAIARSIASSSLVKAAVFGRDPNWGRIAMAAGNAGVDFEPTRLSVWLGPYQLVQNGEPIPFDGAAASSYMAVKAAAVVDEYCSDGDTVQILVNVGSGDGEGIAWGCDLSYKYIEINSEYST